MNFLKQTIVAGLFSVLSFEPAYAQLQCDGVSLTLDDSSARANLAIVLGRSNKEAIMTAVDLPGNKALLRKSLEFGYDRSRADLIQDFQTINSGEKIAKDYFGLNQVKEKAGDVQAMLDFLQKDKVAIVNRICETLKPFFPPNYEKNITIQILSGGYATGFTFDGEPDFYLAAQRIGNDQPGLELVLIHELFHVVQADVSPLKIEMIEAEKKKSATRGNVLAHLYNGYMEGVATFVANPSDFKGEGDTVRFFKDGMEANMKYIGRQFVIYEAYLSQLYYDKDADEQKIYSAGFYDDGPLYFVGYYMAEALEEKLGKGHIKKLMSQHPAQFYLDYIALCRQDKKLHCFSENGEKIIRSVMN